MIKTGPWTKWIFRLLVQPCKCVKFFLRRNTSKLAAVLSCCVILIIFSNVNHSSVVTIEKSAWEEKYPINEDNLTRITVLPNENTEIKSKEEIDEKQTFDRTPCPKHPPNLIGNITVDPHLTTSFEEVERIVGSRLQHGGCHVPSCEPVQKLAIIIPFKDRDAHLRTLLYYLHPMLIRQQSQYCIYVTEQFDFGQFNKALIMNAAFKEVMKIDDYDCVVFHDVDMIPENDNNLYRCGSNPRHLSPAIDKFDYRPHYGTDFGGVTAISPSQYRKANGHSNMFWGWGGEDNDMEFRIRRKGMKIIPSKLNIGRYKMIPHRHSWQFKVGNMIATLNKTCEERADKDGLIDVQYRMVGKESYKTYTKIFIDLRLIDIQKITMYIDGKPSVDIDLHIGECRWDKYEGKYLDKNILISKEEMEKALRLAPNEKLPMPKEPLPEDQKKSKKDAPMSTTAKPIPAVITSLKDAQKICEALSPECRGVLEDKKTNLYLLRKGGAPRNLVVSSVPQNSNGEKRYFFSNKNAYLKYCPGVMGYLQPHTEAIPISIKDNKVEGWHHFKYVIDFKVLLKPDKLLYFFGAPYFEGQMRRDVDVAPFRWQNFGKPPNFDDPDAKRDFTFETPEFPFPNVPGCYTMESKIMGKHKSPYFIWNLWFEIKSDDREADAKYRDKFVNDEREAQIAKLAASKKEVKVGPIKNKKQRMKEKQEELSQKQAQQINLQKLKDRGILKDTELHIESFVINQKSNGYHEFKKRDGDD